MYGLRIGALSDPTNRLCGDAYFAYAPSAKAGFVESLVGTRQGDNAPIAVWLSYASTAKSPQGTKDEARGSVPNPWT